MIKYAVEYSKSSRAHCKGPAPCTGSQIEPGALRLGKVTSGDYGETVEWRHWGCVTPDILNDLFDKKLDQDVQGYGNLREAEKRKVQVAIANRRIAESDIPATARLSSSSLSATPGAPSQQKRKAASEAAQHGLSLSASSQPASSQSVILQRLSQPIVVEDEEAFYQEEETRDELYCTMNTSVVGIQYYKGLVGSGEEVLLVREPGNKHDRNSIQVKNIAGTQVGHLPRNIAAKLAPLIDQNLISVEGIMHDGNLTGTSWSLSMSLKIFGASDRRDQLEPRLLWATPRQAGFSPRKSTSGPGPSGPSPLATQVYNSFFPGPNIQFSSGVQSQAQQQAIQQQYEAMHKASELRQMLNNLEKVDDEERRTSLLDNLCNTEDVLNLPAHPSPPGVASGELMVDLLKHQSQALQWCIEREYPKLPMTEADKPVQFWKYKRAGSRSFYYNIVTKTPQQITSPPVLGRGALCADSMGLGKTLTMLALILATKKDVSTSYSRSTLVVAPLSVLSNWEKQIDEHCVRDALTYCVYYGAARSMTPMQLKQHDVVITTYQTVVGEFNDPIAEIGMDGPPRKKKKRAKGLFDVNWKRIILDEGHNIRNPRTKMAKAVYELTAERRWVLSGTPIINSPKDLCSILTFLRICHPLDDEDFQKRLLLRPLKDGSPEGAELLRALMSHICIRRTKEMQDAEGKQLVALPPVEMTMVSVTLDPEARALYDDVEAMSQRRVENLVYQNGGMNAVVSTNILGMLTRLRQLALHPGLVPVDYLEQLKKAAENEGSELSAIQISPEEKVRLQSILAHVIEDNEECPICFSVLTYPRITSCGHSFCLGCISQVVSRDGKCPMDRRAITMADVIEPAPPTDLTQASFRHESVEDTDSRAGSSAKIDQLIHLLKLTPNNEKSLVFSQFTSFLDKIAKALNEHGISFLRFDGQMSAKRRQETLEQFSVPLDDDVGATMSSGSFGISFATQRSSTRSSTDHTSSTIVDDQDDEDEDDKDGDDDYVDPNEDADDSEFEHESLILTAIKMKRRAQKGKGKVPTVFKLRERSSTAFNQSLLGDKNPKVMLISLKAGALGLNLTVANNVYLMDPWWQEGIESQAIDRCNRIGQTKTVHVYQLIAENTVESKVIEIQEKKKHLIQQAFSGMKSTETGREKREARLQDLIELFGIRQMAASQKH